MKIHEYQARKLLSEAGVPVPPGEVIESLEQAEQAYGSIGGRVVVKAQVFAGGRGKAGFVKLCDDLGQVRAAVKFMLSNKMVSKQTGPEGMVVRKLLMAAAVDIEREYYIGVAVDRARNTPAMMVSTEGGVEIEEVAARNPKAIIREWLHPHLGLQRFGAARLADALGFADPQQRKTVIKILVALARLFVQNDCSLAEINPLVLTTDGRVLAIDAKINFDDNAMFRHAAIAALHDPSEDNANEVRANRAGLSYIPLDGNIGCLVNGAGLAMATMDIIKLHGGEPANFLDVGGSVSAEGAVEAFRIILSDSKVKGILVNIFGGIAKCDTIAEALIAAAKEIGFDVPVVVRLEGTNVERARAMLDRANISALLPASDLSDAAQKVCKTVA